MSRFRWDSTLLNYRSGHYPDLSTGWYCHRTGAKGHNQERQQREAAEWAAWQAYVLQMQEPLREMDGSLDSNWIVTGEYWRISPDETDYVYLHLGTWLNSIQLAWISMKNWLGAWLNTSKFQLHPQVSYRFRGMDIRRRAIENSIRDVYFLGGWLYPIWYWIVRFIGYVNSVRPHVVDA